MGNSREVDLPNYVSLGTRKCGSCPKYYKFEVALTKYHKTSEIFISFVF